jgi:hypothetical protein
VLSSFSELDLPGLTRMLRRTMLMAIVVGAGAVLVAFMVAPPLAGLGIAIGVGLAILNLRAMDAGVAKVETKGTTNRKVLRRLLGTRTVTRLSVLTIVVIGCLLLSAPLGMGMVIGLVLFQLIFVLNAARAVAGAGVS